MKIFILVCTVLGLLAAGFGYWGQYTVAGRKSYDEMAGMIPFFAYYGGFTLLVLAGICGAYLFFKSN